MKPMDQRAPGLGIADPITEVALDTRNYLYLRADFADFPGEAIPGDHLNALVNGTVDQWIKDFSGGRQGIKGDVLQQVLRMPQSLAHYQTNNFTQKLITDALGLAAGLGVPINNYQGHVVCITNIIMPDSEWIWAGLAGQNTQIIRDFEPHVLVHETMHNFGAGHASRLVTTDQTVISTNSFVIEYGSPWDVMGAGREGYNVPNPILLNMAGWLSAQEVHIPAQDGIFRIYAMDRGGFGDPRAIKVAASDGVYWAGFREREIQEPHLQRGPLIFTESSGTYSLLLDTRPTVGDDIRDASLDLGRSFSNPSGTLWLTPLSRGHDPVHGRQYQDIAVKFRGSGLEALPPTCSVRGPKRIPARLPAVFEYQSLTGSLAPGVVRWNLAGEADSRVGEGISKTWLSSGLYSLSAEANGLIGNVFTNRVDIEVFDPLDHMQEVDTLTDRTLTDAEYGRGHYVIVGERLRYSPDGRVFTDVLSNAFFMDVDFDGERFVAAGQVFDFDQRLWAYGVMTSTDARSWDRIIIGDARFADSQHRIAQVEKTDTQWIGVALHGEVFSSVDGMNWSQSGIMSPKFIVEQMVWSHGALWAVTTTGVLARSLDGLSWTILRNDPKFTFTAITANGDTLIAMGADNALISTDGGQNFSEFMPLGANRAGQLRGVGHIRAVGSGFVGIHSDFISNQSFGYVASDDGVHWDFVGAPLARRPRGFAFSNSGYLAVGDGGKGYFSEVGLSSRSQYISWIEPYFPAPDRVPEKIEFEEDPDGDDADNIVELIHGTNPNDLNSIPSIAISPLAGVSGIRMEIPFNPLFSGNEIQLEISTDLKVWKKPAGDSLEDSVTFTMDENGAPVGVRRFAVRLPAGSTAIFARLEYELSDVVHP